MKTGRIICVGLPRDRVVLDCHVTDRRPVGVRSHCVHKCNVNGLLCIVTVTRISTTDLLLLIIIDYFQLLLIITMPCSTANLLLSIVISHC
jgi:hypothetical protein